MHKVINQHGDVLLVSLKDVPKDAVEVKTKNGFVVERGEGVHEHVIEDMSGVKIFTIGDRMFLSVEKQATITHEEHGKQVIAPGIYEKDIERVFDYELEIERKVMD